MKKEVYERIANENGLKVVATTSNRTGYPRNEGYALTDFETWEQAEKVSSENGLELFWGWQKDGWHHWYIGDWAMHPMTYEEAFCKDCFRFHYSVDEYRQELADDLKEDIEMMREDDATEDEINEFTEKATKQNEETMKMVERYYTNGYVIVLHNGEFYDTCPREMLCFREDVKTFKLIAVEPC